MSARNDKVFEQHLFWLAAHDKQFLKRYIKLLSPGFYINPEEAWLLSECIEFFKEFKEPITEDVLAVKLGNKEGDDKFSVDQVYEIYDREGPDEATQAFMVDYAEDYLKRKHSGSIMQEYIDVVAEEGDFVEAQSILAKGLEMLARSTDGDRGIASDRDLGATMDLMASIINNDERTIRTGIQAVDDILQGGLRRGELGVYLAPPNHGKSQWLTHVSQRAWEQNKGVVYFSFEMPESRILARFYARVINQNSNDVPLYPKDKFVREVTKYRKKGGIDASFIVKRYPQAGANCLEMEQFVEEYRGEGNPVDLVVIDYGDIIAPMTKTGDRREDQAATYMEMRNMAASLDVPIWTASQANRLALKRKTITIEHIADSFDKAKIADYIIAQCQTEAEKKVNELRLFFAKSRFSGQGDQILIDADFSRSSFTVNTVGSRIDESDETRGSRAASGPSTAGRRRP